MPIASNDLMRVSRRCDVMASEMEGPAAMRRVVEVARRCATIDAPSAVKGDIGDLSLSNWWRSNPIELSAEVNGKAQLDGAAAEVRPRGKSAGPWRVLTDGRKSYEAGDRRVSGVRLRKKTNDYVTKYRKVKRRTGAHGGKETWRDATTLMATRASRELPDGVSRAFRSVWG